MLRDIKRAQMFAQFLRLRYLKSIYGKADFNDISLEKGHQEAVARTCSVKKGS